MTAKKPKLSIVSTNHYVRLVYRSALFLWLLADYLIHCLFRNEDFARRMIDKFGKAYSAFGVMFVNGDSLIPVVYVAETDTVCCESSCGSGSLAAAWYLTRDEKDGFHSYNFEQPGGTITVNMAKRQGRYAGTVGGKLTLEEPVTMEIED